MKSQLRENRIRYSQKLLVTFRYDHRQQLGRFNCCLSPILENAQCPSTNIGCFLGEMPLKKIVMNWFKKILIMISSGLLLTSFKKLNDLTLETLQVIYMDILVNFGEIHIFEYFWKNFGYFPKICAPQGRMVTQHPPFTKQSFK